jgi:hypothetical protein
VTDVKSARSAAVIEAIDEIDPEFVVHIASSTLAQILEHCEARAGSRAFPVARERRVSMVVTASMGREVRTAMA